jgi:aryl-alcohol dehydrogenase-like predicted oxidoreductase
MQVMKLSPIAAGLWRLHEWGLDTPGLVKWIEQALALGITSFDHADIYGDYTSRRSLVARWLQRRACATGCRSSPSAASSWSAPTGLRIASSPTTVRARMWWPAWMLR